MHCRMMLTRFCTPVLAVVVLAIIARSAPAAEVVQPFNGKNLEGWKFKQHGPKHKPHWVVGSASLDPKDPRMFKVGPGSELINNVTGHGQGVDAISDQTFGDAIVELEVMVPKGSNSGIYLMGEYEVQVLDSFGNEKNPGQGDMGAIYGAAPPKNPSYKKPGEWSTYEIHWRAPRFDAGGRKTHNARFAKVVLNGRVIHENVEMPGPTPGGVDGKEKPAGPLMFQGDHGPVSYRNIRVKPLDDAGPGADAGDNALDNIQAGPVLDPEARTRRESSNVRVCDPPELQDEGKPIILFDGSNTAQWRGDKGGEAKWDVKDGVLTIVPGAGSIVTKNAFRDFDLHLEFNIHPAERDRANTQANGNSGVYIQKRYEVQILDSHGREPEDNGCAAIYKQRKPDRNASKPAGEWQTYDITFHAPRWDGDKKVKNARITVVHNGVTVHDDVEVTAKTGAGETEGPAPGPILLQEHGDVVSFRNITLTPLDH